MVGERYIKHKIYKILITDHSHHTMCGFLQTETAKCSAAGGRRSFIRLNQLMQTIQMNNESPPGSIFLFILILIPSALLLHHSVGDYSSILPSLIPQYNSMSTFSGWGCYTLCCKRVNAVGGTGGGALTYQPAMVGERMKGETVWEGELSKKKMG